MRVIITYNLKKEIRKEGKPADFYSEFDAKKTVEAIASALREGGHQVDLVEADQRLLKYLLEHRKEIDMVFNIAEGINGDSRESLIPAILNFLEIPYTGSGVLAMAVALDKACTKKILERENIPTPRFQLFSTTGEKLSPELKFPLIVKPNAEGSAKGIHASSVVRDKSSLYRQIERVLSQYCQPVLVEEFIEGKELSVGVIGNGRLRVLPILEIDFGSCLGSGEFFYSWRMKEFQGDKRRHLTPTFYCPARLESLLIKEIKELTLRTHRAVGCWDISRTDFRLDKKGNPYVLEINPLPGLDPEESNFPLMAKAAGIKYTDLINTILEAAIERTKQKKFRKEL